MPLDSHILFRFARGLTCPFSAHFPLARVLGGFRTHQAVGTMVLQLFLRRAGRPNQVGIVLLNGFSRTTFLVAFRLPSPRFLHLLTRANGVRRNAHQVQRRTRTVSGLSFSLFRFIFHFNTNGAFVRQRAHVRIEGRVV